MRQNQNFCPGRQRSGDFCRGCVYDRRCITGDCIRKLRGALINPINLQIGGRENPDNFASDMSGAKQHQLLADPRCFFEPEVPHAGLAFLGRGFAVQLADCSSKAGVIRDSFRVGAVYCRNLALMVLLAGGMHLYLYTFKRQGNHLRYDVRPFRKKSALFTFNSQFRDNVFWSVVSGVTVWTAYEVIGLWAYANGFMPMMEFASSPVWFVVWFLLMPFYGVFHFYWIHRLLHWGPLYTYVHALHHRNVNVGPWSGMSMHPVEHIGYLSSVLIHFVFASHPVHFIFQLQQKVLLAVSSHAGYDAVTARQGGDKGLKVGDFFHQLHHRYFECNYGEPEVPCDKWFGTFHDGTEEATARTRVRLKEMRKK